MFSSFVVVQLHFPDVNPVDLGQGSELERREGERGLT